MFERLNPFRRRNMTGKSVKAPLHPDDLRTKVAEHFWWHSIDLGDGVITPGGKSPEVMAAEFAAVFGPLDLEGRSVLDIGAWNGAFAVEAKRRGAERVLATDSLCWTLPVFRGRETFDLVVQQTGLEIEAREIDAMDVRVDTVGRFDVVLFLGVFYHLLNPITALQQLAAVTNEVLVLETHLDARDEQRPAMVLYPGDELGGDASNWWGPNPACVDGLLRAVGFSDVNFVSGSAADRGVFHAWKSARP